MNKTEKDQLDRIASWTRSLAEAHRRMDDAVTADEQARIIGDAGDITFRHVLRIDAAAQVGMCQAMLTLAFQRVGIVL